MYFERTGTLALLNSGTKDTCVPRSIAPVLVQPSGMVCPAGGEPTSSLLYLCMPTH
nr:hypothetical protein Q903MT_gene3023 [Picea sitchensis]